MPATELGVAKLLRMPAAASRLILTKRTFRGVGKGRAQLRQKPRAPADASIACQQSKQPEQVPGSCGVRRISRFDANKEDANKESSDLVLKKQPKRGGSSVGEALVRTDGQSFAGRRCPARSEDPRLCGHICTQIPIDGSRH